MAIQLMINMEIKKVRVIKIFIKMYYTISPKIVAIFGKKQWFNKIWKKFLDKKVKKLKEKGYKDLPYQDRF